MFGKNKILKPENTDGSSLAIQEIFPTFQGEGPFVGYPSVFVRLGGCNLACDFCDTEFDSFKEQNLNEIVARIIELAGVVNVGAEEKFSAAKEVDMKQKFVAKYSSAQQKFLRNLVVITGGEPLRQNIAPLCQELINRGFLVQIETNGTLFRELPKEVKIICSPKNTGKNYHKIRADLLARIDAIKFIISASKLEYQGVAEVGQSEFNIPIYLQPMDEYDDKKNQQKVARVLELAASLGARVSLQMHKIWGVR